MHIRTFRAANLQAALEEIRRQMGPDASVLHTRQVRDGWLGWLGRTRVEVTAGMHDAAAGEGRRGPSASPHAVPPALPSALAECRQELIRLGVAEGVARRWTENAAGMQAASGDVGPAAEASEQVRRAVAGELILRGPIRTRPGQRRVVALVGPTGVGKTTTIAKLAAGFRIEAKRQVGLLTIDTFRIAAVQQLKAYAEIMDLPMEVVARPEEMGEALGRLAGVDLVLIDTAGRSPHSEARIGQLSALLRAAKPDETHLVLSATSSASAVGGVLRGFAAIRPTAAIVTKLDEAAHTAGILAALDHGGQGSGAIPLSYLTHGQEVPDDIAVAERDLLVGRLLPAQRSPSLLAAA